MRQRLLRQYDPKAGVSISTLAYEYPLGYDVAEHAHGSDQLIYATCGVMEISAGRSLWMTPPHLAVWIPAETRHQIRMPSPVSMRVKKIKPRPLGSLQREMAGDHLASERTLFPDPSECAAHLFEEFLRRLPLLSHNHHPWRATRNAVNRRANVSSASGKGNRLLSVHLLAVASSTTAAFSKARALGMKSKADQIRAVA